MADWHLIDLEFVAPPDSEALCAANAWASNADYDAPTLTARGWQAQRWRGPLFDDATLARRFGEFGLV